MRIAQVAPLWEAVPPVGYGGTERVVSYLTEELVRRGHDVTLFATGDSRTTAKLVPVVAQGLRRIEASPDAATAEHVRMLGRASGAPTASTSSRVTWATGRSPSRSGAHPHGHPRSAGPAVLADGLPGAGSRAARLHQPSRRAARRRAAAWVATVHHGIPLRDSSAPRPTAGTSRSSAASPRRKGRTWPSPSPCASACRSPSPRRWTRPTASTSSAPSLRASGARSSRSSERSTATRSWRSFGRARPAVPHPLAGAVRARDARGHGLRRLRSSPDAWARRRRSLRTGEPASSPTRLRP